MQHSLETRAYNLRSVKLADISLREHSKGKWDIQEHLELLSSGSNMNEDQFLDEPNSDSFNGPIFRKAQDDAELVTEVFETLVASVKIIHLVAAEQEFHAIRQERIIVVPHHDTLKNLFI